MNMERLQAKGLLSDYKRKFGHLDIEAKGLIILIRTLLSPWEEDISKLKTDEAKVAAEKLDNIRSEMSALKTKIAAIEEDLG